MYVVIMLELALPGEKLSVSQQINEVFGPFTEEEADAWAEKARHLIQNRTWIIIPLSDPGILNNTSKFYCQLCGKRPATVGFNCKPCTDAAAQRDNERAEDERGEQ